MEEKRQALCIVCGKILDYRFGRPRKACDNPQCQQALQKLRARRFKLKKKRIMSEASYQLKQIQIDYYEPTFTNEDLGNPLNIGSTLEIIPCYSGFEFTGFKSLDPLTIEFFKDSMLFQRKHPDLVKCPDHIQGKKRIHRIGPGELYHACTLCYSTKLVWTDQGWYCTECGNEIDFSLP